MITVFTPVYNRKYIIKQLYDSLLRQTCYDFEWLVVDDGSTDGLETLINEWQEQKPPFPIVYRYVENGGKHRAINFGAKIAKGEIFFIVDSDDCLTEDAIEFVAVEFPKIMEDPTFAGISGLKCTEKDGPIIGGVPIFNNYVDATNLERVQYGLQGDKAAIYKTAVWKKYPFPEYKGENFLSEGVTLNEIAQEGLKIRWYHKILYYGNYIEDGLTKNIFEKRIENQQGWAANIVSNVKYVYYDKESIFKERYLFFECMHKRYSQERICELLEIDDNEYYYLRNKWDHLLDAIDFILKQHQTVSLALYGMGMNAKRLMQYLDDLGVNIQYGIDKNYKQISFQPTYDFAMQLPAVDSICITMREYTPEVRKALQNKLPDSYIWSLAELDNIFK